MKAEQTEREADRLDRYQHLGPLPEPTPEEAPKRPSLLKRPHPGAKRQSSSPSADKDKAPKEAAPAPAELPVLVCSPVDLDPEPPKKKRLRLVRSHVFKAFGTFRSHERMKPRTLLRRGEPPRTPPAAQAPAMSKPAVPAPVPAVPPAPAKQAPVMPLPAPASAPVAPAALPDAGPTPKRLRSEAQGMESPRRLAPKAAGRPR